MVQSQRTGGTVSEPEFRRCYTYSWPRRIYYGVLGILSTLFAMPFLTAPIWVIVMFIVGQFFHPILFLFSVWGTLLATVFITFFLNHGQTICISNRYLEARFFYVFWTRIPWEDVVEILPSVVPNMRGSVVTAKKITPLHYILGWQFGKTFQPAITFTTEIRNYEELLGQIHRRSGIIIP